MTALSRRRFLAISAAAVATPAAASPVARWRGTALGAHAEMRLVGLDPADATPVFRAVTAEIARLESIFSLYKDSSAISRLNRDGQLDAPPPEMLHLCSVSSALHQATEGAFDPTVQPLWTLAASRLAKGAQPNPDEIARAVALTGWRNVTYDPARIAFTQQGMAITLNGIAQGYVTDRIANTLRSFGLTDILIDVGEIRAAGASHDGSPWKVGIASPDGGAVLARITLTDRALATSAPFGTRMDDAGKLGHIFDPKTGATASRIRQVSVSAPTAVVADGLSTALCAADTARHPVALAAFPGARIEHIAV